MKNHIVGLCLVGMLFSGGIAFGQAAHSPRTGSSQDAPMRVIEHPLTPLTSAEIRKTHKIVSAYFTNSANHLPSDKLRIPILVLKEPAKAVSQSRHASLLR